jgi:hypothetical protein
MAWLRISEKPLSLIPVYFSSRGKQIGMSNGKGQIVYFWQLGSENETKMLNF